MTERVLAIHSVTQSQVSGQPHLTPSKSFFCGPASPVHKAFSAVGDFLGIQLKITKHLCCPWKTSWGPLCNFLPVSHVNRQRITYSLQPPPPFQLSCSVDCNCLVPLGCRNASRESERESRILPLPLPASPVDRGAAKATPHLLWFRSALSPMDKEMGERSVYSRSLQPLQGLLFMILALAVWVFVFNSFEEPNVEAASQPAHYRDCTAPCFSPSTYR